MLKKITLLLFSIVCFFTVSSQEIEKLTLNEILELARSQSPDAIMAKHRFRANYWEFRTYVAKYRPSLTLSGTIPSYNRLFEKEFDFSTGQEQYVEKNTNSSSLNLSLSQNIGLTGGSIFMQSGLTRFDILGTDGSSQYISTPVSIGFIQPISGYNSFKWEKKIEPLKYEEAKQDFLNDLEDVHLKGVNLFFNLALAQQNLEISKVNYSNSDTLFRIAQGRYQIGTIAEDELLQMELRFLNAGNDLRKAGIDLQIREFQMRSFLGFNDNIKIELIIPDEIPELEVDVQKAINQANENNPELLFLERQLLEAAMNVAEAKSEKGLNADLFATYGLTQRSDDFSNAYVDPLSQQRVRIGIELPIVDWGLGKGRYKMAQSSQEVVKTTVQQARVDFEQNIFLNVAQFNLQDDQLFSAAKADTIAQKRYEVSKQRFLIGKIDVLDLNVADTEKDVAKREYLSALRNYWTFFYTVRRLTLYDFENDLPVSADFTKLVD
ncbi:MAG: TolC family protein [Bacteroidetes bacterium]|nr:TolC family protein [Bacteroidota bacterium]